MNKKLQFIILSILILLYFSCSSVKKTGKAEPIMSLKTGWYLFDFECTYKGIEEEYTQFLTTKTKVVQELIYKYTGVVCYVENGVLYDPVAGVELLINGDGGINCAENISIRGRFEKDGRFFWCGLKEEYKRLTSIFVKGTLRPLLDTDIGGKEYDGIYHLIDAGTKRERLVNIKNGFYTWKFIDGRGSEFAPWPLLVRPDGSVTSSRDITTIIEIGSISKVNYTTGFTMKGKIVPGQKAAMDEVPQSSGAAREQKEVPRFYTGTMIRPGEYHADAIPKDMENFVKDGRTAIKAEPKPNPAKYPSWYLKLPAKPGFVYAAGEKSSAVQKTAFAIAEAAAANLAEQTRLYIEGNKNKSTQPLNYKIIEQHYNEETHTAFVLAEMPLK